MRITFEIKNRDDVAIAYSDENLLVVYKPALVHSVSQQDSYLSVESFLMAGDFVDISLPECGLLQRLDYVTAGLMLVARNSDVYEQLKKQSKAGQLEKEYEAVTSSGDGYFVPEGYTSEEWLQTCHDAPWQVTVESRFVYREKGRQAVRLISKSSKSKNASVIYRTHIRLQNVINDRFHFKIQLSKGYRHQVRATLSAIGFPIVGDALYGGVDAEQLQFRATSIKFYHPVTQKKYHIEWIDSSNSNWL